MGEWIRTQLTTRHDWTDGLMTLRFDEVKPHFTPGQFFNLGLTVGDKRVRRAYSAASAPDAPLEFVISRVAEGEFTPHLFDLQPGQVAELDTTPAGFFTLDFLPPGVKDLWLVATGTGIGPYISMIRAGVLGVYERVVVVHGVRHLAEHTYAEELRRFTELPQRFYVPTCTGESDPAVLHGRIPALFQFESIERTVGVPLDPTRSHLLLCGNPGMIKDGLAVLEDRGYRRHKRREPGHITTEKYW